MNTGHQEVELIPDQAMYRPGEKVRLRISSKVDRSLIGWKYEYTVWDLNSPKVSGHGEVYGEGFEVFIHPITDGSGAYGVFMTLTSSEGNKLQVETAFDVANHWREAPRYGFLSDFSAEETGKLDDIDFLSKHHINLVQFYDWMYRHDRLLPDEEHFIDPLGRSISLPVIREKIAALREKGISSIAYAAVYASLSDYIEKHPEQGLYQNDGKVQSLGNYFHIMDISEDSAWTAHILEEFASAVQQMDFDGLHLDQYGFPKKAIRQVQGGEVVALKDLYPSFIDQVRNRLQDTGIIFNNVSNYPVKTTARAMQDIIYIEVWDPVTHLRDLKHMIDWAKELSGKHVVLAAYLPAFHPDREVDQEGAEIGATLTMASIFASGGYHLLLGEHSNILTEGYYPKYGSVSEPFKKTLQTYYDFIVMYRSLLFDSELDDVSMTFTGGINMEVVFEKEGVAFTPNERMQAVWTIVKEKPGYLVLQLINLCGIDNDVWHEGKKLRPVEQHHIDVKIEILEEIEDIYWTSPDRDSIQAESLSYEWVPKGESNGNYVRVTLPRLAYWSMLVIQTRHGIPRII